MQKDTCKQDWKQEGRTGDDKWRKTWGRGWGEGDEKITKLKTNVISAVALKKQCLLLCEACLAACSRGWVQHCRMTLLLNFFLFVFLPNPEMLSLHEEEEQREQGVLYGETSSCRYCGVVLCANWYVRWRILYSVGLETGSWCSVGRTEVIWPWNFVLVTIYASISILDLSLAI